MLILPMNRSAPHCTQVQIPLLHGSLKDVIADDTTGTNSIPENSMDVDTAATDEV
jgi:hypothetical protein